MWHKYIKKTLCDNIKIYLSYSRYIVNSISKLFHLYLNEIAKISSKAYIKFISIFKLYLLGNIYKINQTKLCIFIVISICVFIVFTSIYPSTNNFEGFLFVRELSFNYSGNKSNKLFLKRIPSIEFLSISGSQNITIKGEFKHPYDPDLNFNGSLEIELENEIGQISFSSANNIEIRELRLDFSTIIKNLKFNPFENSGYFSLRAPLSDLSSASSHSIMSVNLGEMPVNISLKGFRLPKIGKKDTLDKPNPINDLIFLPGNPELNMFFTTKNDIYFQLNDSQNINYNDWFTNRIEVKNVDFYENSILSLEDSVPISSIIEGQILMAGKELKVETDQFLMYDDPGIQVIRRIDISPEKGIGIRFSGKSQRIQVGLDPSFPVSSIKSGWLNRFFTHETLTIITSLSTAIIVSSFSLIISNSSKSNKK